MQVVVNVGEQEKGSITDHPWARPEQDRKEIEKSRFDSR